MERGPNARNASCSVVSGSDNAFDSQVGVERPAELVLRSPGAVRLCWRKLRGPTSAEQTSNDGASVNWMPVPENWSGATASSQRSMSEEV